MFTGIVEEVGRIAQVYEQDGNVRLEIEAARVMDDLELGDSIAVSGCCLTVAALNAKRFQVDLSRETVTKTAPRYQVARRVNLERAMRADGRFGGHFVSGHVEGVGEVLDVQGDPGAYILTVQAPKHLRRYLVPKGSIAVDGVSLTVVDVGGPAGSHSELPSGVFTLWLVPHTLEVTTLGELTKGSQVNLEPDLIAKYLERLVKEG